MPPTDAAAIFRQVDRVTWVVTAQADDRRGGLIATWISQASLDDSRVVVVAGLGANHFTTELVDASGLFALHLFRPEQATTALQFALGSGRDRDKLANIAHDNSRGVPLIADCAAGMICRVFARLNTGDRIYFWADVEFAQQHSNKSPLRESQLIAAASEEQLQQLRVDRESDAAVGLVASDAWRQQLPANLQFPGTFRH